MPKHNNYIYFAVGLLFALIFVGTDLKTAKADYVTMFGDKPIEVKYNADTKKLDVYYVGETEPLATGVSFTQDESTNNRGVLDMEDLEAKSEGKISKDTEIEVPEGREITDATGDPVMDSSERAEDYSCTQVRDCGTTVRGYNDDDNNPTYALFNDTTVQEIVTIFLRNSDPSEGAGAWDKAEKQAGDLVDKYDLKDVDMLTVREVNNILKDLKANFKVSGDPTDTVSRLDLLKALADRNEEEDDEPSGEEDNEEDNHPGLPIIPVVSTECSFSAAPTEILYSKSSQLSWNCNKVNGCLIKDEFNAVVQSPLPTVSGGVKVTPLKTTRYYLNCPENKTWEALVRVFSSGIQ
jgi:hypothetical protein